MGTLGNVLQILSPTRHLRECITRFVAQWAPLGRYLKFCHPVGTIGNVLQGLSFSIGFLITFSGQARLDCPDGEDEDDND